MRECAKTKKAKIFVVTIEAGFNELFKCESLQKLSMLIEASLKVIQNKEIFKHFA